MRSFLSLGSLGAVLLKVISLVGFGRIGCGLGRLLVRVGGVGATCWIAECGT